MRLDRSRLGHSFGSRQEREKEVRQLIGQLTRKKKPKLAHAKGKTDQNECFLLWTMAVSNMATMNSSVIASAVNSGIT